MKAWLLLMALLVLAAFVSAETLHLRLTDHAIICTVPADARQVEAGIAPYFASARTLTARDLRHQVFQIPTFTCDDPNDEVVAYCAVPGTTVRQPIPCFRVGRTN